MKARALFTAVLLAIAIVSAAAAQDQCVLVDFEEFEPDVVVTESQGVTFEEDEFRTFPGDCTPQVDCPCDDDDLSFPGAGNILIAQEPDSQCTPDDSRFGALFMITPTFISEGFSGVVYDVEEGDTLRIYLDGQLVLEESHEGGDNEYIEWSTDVIGDYLEIECVGTCAIDDLEFCPTSEPVLGAGCLEDGSCIDEITEEDYYALDLAIDDQWQEGANCDELDCEIPPVIGAGCLTDGSCVDQISEEDYYALDLALENGWQEGANCDELDCETPVPAIPWPALPILGLLSLVAVGWWLGRLPE